MKEDSVTRRLQAQLDRHADLPPGDHHCIIKFSTVYIPGDERSRTNPGRGYPESTETTITCAVYPTREAWLAEIERLTARQSWGGRDWVALVAHVPAVTTSVKVDVR